MGDTHPLGRTEGGTITLDGAVYKRWAFHDCVFLYNGGPKPVFEACVFSGYNELKLADGPAADTIETLRMLDQIMPGLLDALLRPGAPTGPYN